MSNISIKTSLRVWRRKYGEEKTAKAHGQTYFRIPIQNRRHLVILFLRWMKMLGLEEERFRKSSFQDELIDICFGTAPAFDEKKRKGGHNALKEELEDILDVEGIFSGKRRRNNKNARPTHVAPVAPPRPEPVKETIIVREDVAEAPYEADDTVLDEDFLNALKEASDE